MDNNLLGVSGQVTASGVLVFAEIFGELSLGDGEGSKSPSEKFASGKPSGIALGGRPPVMSSRRPGRGIDGLGLVDSSGGLGRRWTSAPSCRTQPRLSYRPHQSPPVCGVHRVGKRPV
ncbi:hypothetical protein I547_2570 [Mycobacterium kansasii 824]|nr:hypothetical protein I547_2570 [Mycobacterium kansasii 824]